VPKDWLGRTSAKSSKWSILRRSGRKTSIKQSVAVSRERASVVLALMTSYGDGRLWLRVIHWRRSSPKLCRHAMD